MVDEDDSNQYHRRSQGVHLHPQGGEKFFRRNLQEKFFSANPRQNKSQFLRTFFAGRGRFGGLEWFI